MGVDAETIPAGRELDALVAEKVMGFEVTNYEPIGIRKGGWILPIPNYSTEIKDAWEVVEKLNLFEKYLLAKSDVNWCIGGDFSRELSFEEQAIASGNTAPLAICRAALKVMGL